MAKTMEGPLAGHPVQNPYGAVNPPVVRSSTFTFPTAAEGAARFQGGPGLIYTRLDNPTTAALEQELARLEGAEGAVATGSGMGAIHIALMSLLRPGARLVADDCVYGCTHALLRKLERWGVELVSVQTSDPDTLRSAIGDGVDVVFLETPMNPNLRMVDLEQAAEWTHAAGGKLVVDNTFATPIAQNPLRHGADLVVHSLTKGVNGHADIIAGAVVGPESLLGSVREWRKDAGPTLDPDAAYMVLRGARTLGLRVERMNESALHLAKVLRADGVKVRHPMLPDHPDHAVARRQMPLGGHVFTLDLGTQEAAQAFLDNVRVFQCAVSLGGVESLAQHPATMTHAGLTPEDQARAEITPGLVRLSVGIEPVEELLADIRQALAAVHTVTA